MLSCILLCVSSLVVATPILYDGRAPLNLTEAGIDASTGPYLSAVKGTQNASHYETLLNTTLAPTPLWSNQLQEQPISIIIDNTSIFTPGGSAPQNGFRRTDLIAQPTPPDSDPDRTAFNSLIESNVTAFHFSVMADENRSLNLSHEYQVVWIEPSDGSHVFELQIGTPFNSTPSDDSNSLKIRSHDFTELFATPFTPATWHNFAVVIDWNNKTLTTLYSTNATTLQAVTGAEPNLSEASGAAGQGDFHFGVLKLPLIDPIETPTEQADVVHFGIQEGTTEGLIYSGIFVESVVDGVSVGQGRVLRI